MTEEHGKTATGVSFCELKYSTPTLEDYIEALPLRIINLQQRIIVGLIFLLYTSLKENGVLIGQTQWRVIP